MGKRLDKQQKERNRKAFEQLTDYLTSAPNNITYKAIAAKLNVVEGKMWEWRSGRHTVYEEDLEALRHAYRAELADFGQPTPLEQELANLKALAEEQARRLANQEEVIAGLARILEDPDEWVRRLAQVQAEIARLKEEEEEKPRPVSRRGAFYLLTLSLILEDLTGNVPCFALLLLFFFPDG